MQALLGLLGLQSTRPRHHEHPGLRHPPTFAALMPELPLGSNRYLGEEFWRACAADATLDAAAQDVLLRCTDAPDACREWSDAARAMRPWLDGGELWANNRYPEGRRPCALEWKLRLKAEKCEVVPEELRRANYGFVLECCRDPAFMKRLRELSSERDWVGEYKDLPARAQFDNTPCEVVEFDLEGRPSFRVEKPISERNSCSYIF